MKADILRIGNSKGIIIPAKLFRLLGIHDKVRMTVKGSSLTIEPLEENPRKGWRKQFLEAGSQDDKELLIPAIFEDEALEDWQW